MTGRTAPGALEDARQPTPASGLGCLVAIGRLHGLDLSADALARAEDIGFGEPDRETLAACAERAGFRCRSVRLDWRGLARLGRALPAIVLLRDGRARVLQRCEAEGDSPGVSLIDPSHGETPIAMTRAAFEAIWSGDVLLLKVPPAAVGGDQSFGWGTIRAMAMADRRLLRDLAIATIVLAVLALAPVGFAWAMISETLSFHARSTFVFLGVAFGMVVLFEAAFAAVRRGLLARLSSRLGLRLDALIMDRVLRLPVTAFERTSAGLLAHRIERTAAIRAALAGPLAGLALDAGVAILALLAMAAVSVALTVVVLVLGALTASVLILTVPRHRRAAFSLAAADAEADAALAQAIGGFATIKTLGLEPARRRRWDVLVARQARRRLAEADAANRAQTLAGLFERCMIYGPLMLGGLFAIGVDGPLPRPALVVFLLLSARAAAPLRDLAGLIQPIAAARAAADMVADLANTPPERAATKRGARLPLGGAIAFANVTFTYPDATTPALRDATFEVTPGTIVGIAGRNAAGKSTIARLLQGLHADFQGLIKLDGLDLREFDLDHLRGSVAVVGPHDPLLAGTVRDIILAARPEAGDEAMIRAARLVGAEADIAALPQGYDTLIGEGAIGLSDGERQRLGIARALVADPAILILDEATAALDPEGEALLASNLRRIARSRTVIIASQRLAALVQADVILVLERGAVEDIGRHRDLVERCDIYRGLWQRQTVRPAPGRPDESLPRGVHVA